MDRRHFLPLALCAAAFCGALLASRPSAPAAAGAAATAAGLSEVTYKMANWSDCASFDDVRRHVVHGPSPCAAFDVAACNRTARRAGASTCAGARARARGRDLRGRVLRHRDDVRAHRDDMLSAAAVEGSAELSYGQGAAGRFGDALSNGCDHHLYCGFCESTPRAASRPCRRSRTARSGESGKRNVRARTSCAS